jgi:hypothetical protein
VFLHAVIQDIITDTADKLSRYGYILTVSGAEELQHTVFEKIDETSGKLGEYLGETTGGLVDVDFESILSEFSKEKLEELKGIALIPILKGLIKNKIEAEQGEDADRYLRRLHVVNGFDGLDFRMSSFLADEKDINITVRYYVDIPLPIDIMPKFNVVQSSVVRAWMSGEKEYSNINDNNNIWELPPLERGRKIQKLFGRSADMPHNFPVIAKFDGGKAISIKSINLNSPSYQKSSNVRKVIIEYINEIKSFKGAKVGNYEIKESEIVAKQILIIIPNGSTNSEIQSILNQCKAIALSKGISFMVEEL